MKWLAAQRLERENYGREDIGGVTTWRVKRVKNLPGELKDFFTVIEDL